MTVLEGAVAAANASGNAFQIHYERGACLGMTPGCPCPAFPHNQFSKACGIDDTKRVHLAADLAARADLTILVLGDSSTIMAGDPKAHEETGTCGEHFDRDNFDLVGAQLPLLRSVLNATQHVVLVLIHGRPVTFGASATDGYNAMYYTVPAVVSTWRPGEEAGHAVWSILNGTTNPSGRAARTWPRTVGQVRQYTPWFNYKGTRSQNDNYADGAPATPLVAFGEGLSYTNYTLSKHNIPTSTVTTNQTFSMNLQVSSSGPAGMCVVQVYFSARLSSRVRFNMALLGFAKVNVPANSNGIQATVELESRGLEMWDKRLRRYVVETGTYDLHVGQSSVDPRMKHIELKVASVLD